MEFGWINVFGAIIVTLMLIPNIVYAIKNRNIFIIEGSSVIWKKTKKN